MTLTNIRCQRCIQSFEMNIRQRRRMIGRIKGQRDTNKASLAKPIIGLRRFCPFDRQLLHLGRLVYRLVSQPSDESTGPSRPIHLLRTNALQRRTFSLSTTMRIGNRKIWVCKLQLSVRYDWLFMLLVEDE
jgi:hypothetical protein